ncbi:MAG: hypothetical protein IJG38_06905 [Thermoguttaceae bacterium]|nr:hypothetical protein [Thermoguttaceae bacterium]
MKNRTSLTLVISLLVCSLTAGAFAQTNPSVLKPEDSTLEARPSDIQLAQEENANGQCPYKVVPGDKVYLQIKNIKLRSDNLPLYPYFYVYGKNGDDWKYISGTSSQDGNQICEKVQNPPNFQFYIDNTYQDYYLDVHSKWYFGKQLVAKGVSFKTAPLIQWAINPNNVGQTFKLNISNGNDIELRFVRAKNDRYYYFEIVSYKIRNIDNEYKKYLYEAYQTWLLTKQNGVEDKWLYYYKGDKKFNPATENAQDYTEIAQNKYKKEQRELLFPCTEGNNVKFMFSFDGKKYSLDTVELTTDDVVNQLNDCIQKYPDDPTKWVVKCVSKQKSEIELNFAGGLEKKSEGGTKESVKSEKVIEPEQYTEPDNSPCPYKVTKDDKIYLQLSSVKIDLKNIPLQPYFSLYQIQNTGEKHFKTTSAQAGNQINKNVAYPTKYQIYFDFESEQKDYRLDVLSDWGDHVVAKGATFNIGRLIKWVQNPVNRGGTFELEISKGNTVGLKLNTVSSERYYYFDIVSYKITKIDEDFYKYVIASYQPWVNYSTNTNTLYVYPKTANREPATEATPEGVKLTFDNTVSNSELLFSCGLNNAVTFTIANKMGEQGHIQLSAYEVRKQLNDCMKKFPEDHTKWVVKFTDGNNSEIELSLAGIRKIYRITSVSIPVGNPARDNPRYSEDGYAPWLRIYIQQNGVPCGLESEYATPGRRAWEGNIPNDKYNRFEIREGTNAKFSLQIKDADTWFYEIFLIGISDIKDLDFAQKNIFEKLSKQYAKEKRAVIEFEEVKQ